jgi:hypothetical protein
MDNKVYSLFSIPVYETIVKLTINEEKKLNNYIKNNKEKINISKNYILHDEKLIFLNKKILNEINYYKENILKYSNNFKLTTSWITETTKIDTGGHELHSHKNCFISGVFYINEGLGFAPIEFLNFDNSGFYLKPTEWNNYNSYNFKINIKKNMLLLFPSKLLHKIGKHNSDISRHSIAFNVLPVGEIGEGDSTLILK